MDPRAATRPSGPFARLAPLAGHVRGPAVVAASAALLAGAHLVVLVLFLNPALDPGASIALRATIVYSALAFPLLWLGAIVAERRFRLSSLRALPWAIAAELALVATAYVTHAAHFTFYLAPSVNAQMLRSVPVLAGLSLIAFYTALLHASHARAYGARSVALLALVAATSLVVVAVRRERAHLASAMPRPAPPTIEPDRAVPKLLVVLVPGASLDVILPSAEQGKLAFFAELLEQGAYARLHGLSPARPLALEASVATGKLPYRHALVDPERYRLLPFGGAARFALLPAGVGFGKWGALGASPWPVAASDRRARTLWEGLALLGYRIGAIGVPESLLADENLVVAASDSDFGEAVASRMRPPELAARAAALRPRADTIPPALARVLSPRGERSLVPPALGDRWRLALAEDTVRGSSVDALFVRLPGTATAALSTFGGFAAAELEGNRAAEARRAADALVSYYSELDRRLEEIWSALTPPRILVVVSAFGVDSPRGFSRLAVSFSEAGRVAGTIDGAPDGFMILRGDGVRSGVSLGAADLTDVVPTLLYGWGLPTARDLDGRALVDAFESGFLERHPLIFVPSYEGLGAR